MALSWLNLPCALKAAIGDGKQTLGDPASLPRHTGRSKAWALSRSLRAPSHGPNGGRGHWKINRKPFFAASNGG
jgi:hypothetical protein